MYRMSKGPSLLLQDLLHLLHLLLLSCQVGLGNLGLDLELSKEPEHPMHLHSYCEEQDPEHIDSCLVGHLGGLCLLPEHGLIVFLVDSWF